MQRAVLIVIGACTVVRESASRQSEHGSRPYSSIEDKLDGSKPFQPHPTVVWHGWVPLGPTERPPGARGKRCFSGYFNQRFARPKTTPISMVAWCGRWGTRAVRVAHSGTTVVAGPRGRAPTLTLRATRTSLSEILSLSISYHGSYSARAPPTSAGTGAIDGLVLLARHAALERGLAGHQSRRARRQAGTPTAAVGRSATGPRPRLRGRGGAT